MVYFGARHYDLATATWMTQDAYRGAVRAPVTLHRYGYSNHNPINYVDPTGQFACGDGYDDARCEQFDPPAASEQSTQEESSDDDASAAADTGNFSDWDGYAYGLNNPTNGTDPTNHWPDIPNIDFHFSTGVIGNLYDRVGNMVGIDNASQLVSGGLSFVGFGFDCLAGATDIAATALVATSTVVGATSGAAITLPGGGTTVVGGLTGGSVGWAMGEIGVQPIIAAGNVLASIATVYNIEADFISGNTEYSLSVVENNNGLDVESNLTVGPSTQLGLYTTGLGWVAPLALPSTLLQIGAIAGDLGVNPLKPAHFDQEFSSKDGRYYYDASIYYSPE